MKTVNIKKLVIGEGVPKICVPIVSKTKEEILYIGKKIKDTSADLVEWRVDWFSDLQDIEKIKDVAKELSIELGDIPLLFTIRTKNEGGECDITTDEYIKINMELARTGYVDLIDIEILQIEKYASDVILEIQSFGVKVIGSNHNFKKTPTKDDIIEILKKMQNLGVDISKIAVMPTSKKDLLELLEATMIMSEKYADRPFITISMGKIGMLSRISGELFGSAITFGTVGDVSAPGQIDSEDLAKILKILS